MSACTKCGQEKPDSDFGTYRKRRASGDHVVRRTVCRTCFNAMVRSRRGTPAERRRVSEYNRQRYEADRQAFRDKARRWRQENRDRDRLIQRNHQARRRALATNSAAERIDYLTVYRRDDGLCAICGAPASVDEGSIDHIVPLSKGGEHTYANVQLAHKSCNFAKGNRALPAGEQLRLIG